MVFTDLKATVGVSRGYRTIALNFGLRRKDQRQIQPAAATAAAVESLAFEPPHTTKPASVAVLR